MLAVQPTGGGLTKCSPITPALMPAAIRMFAMQVRYRAADGGPTFVRFLWLLTPIHAFGVLWLAAWVLATMRLTVAIVVATW